MAQFENHTYQMERQDTVSELSSSSSDVTDHEAEDRYSSSLDLSKFASQTPIHEGMVFKVGGKGRLKRIQKRFFILYEGVIIYYHHNTTYQKDKKRGFVSLICTIIHACMLCTMDAMAHAALCMYV